MNVLKIILIFISVVYTGNSFAQTFELAQPDTAKLKLVRNVLDYSESLGYIYLKEYYKIKTPIDSVEIYDWDPEGGVCAFQQDFEFSIHYKLWKCREAGGITETITLPKIEITDIRKFIELLFYDEFNQWTDENRYEPDGAGCYYEIIQNETNTIIEIYCGC